MPCKIGSTLQQREESGKDSSARESGNETIANDPGEPNTRPVKVRRKRR